MKRIFFICIVLLAMAQNIFSQNEGKKWTIQASPLLWLFSDLYAYDANDTLFIIDLEGQYKINNNSNISLTLSFLYNDSTFYENENNSVNDIYSYNDTYYQIGFKPMYIHRPFDTGLKGFFIGIYPNLGFRYSTINNDNTLYTELGFGVNLGYKWIFGNGFTIQIGGGIGRTFSFPKKPNNDFYTNFTNSDGRLTIKNSDINPLDFKLGYSF